MQSEIVNRMKPGQNYTFQQMKRMLGDQVVYESGSLRDTEIKRIVGNLVQEGVCELTLDEKQQCVRMIAR